MSGLLQNMEKRGWVGLTGVGGGGVGGGGFSLYMKMYRTIPYTSAGIQHIRYVCIGSLSSKNLYKGFKNLSLCMMVFTNVNQNFIFQSFCLSV